MGGSEERRLGECAAAGLLYPGIPAPHQPHLDQRRICADLLCPAVQQLEVPVVAAKGEAADRRLLESALVNESRHAVLVDELRAQAVAGDPDRPHEHHSQ